MINATMTRLLCHSNSNDEVAVNGPSVSSEERRVLHEKNVIHRAACILRVALESAVSGETGCVSDERMDQ